MTKNTGIGPLIDRFLPRFDVRERHETVVRAPPAFVLDIARNFDLQSDAVIRAIFWLRGMLMGAKRPGAAPHGLVEDMPAIRRTAERRWRESNDTRGQAKNN